MPYHLAQFCDLGEALPFQVFRFGRDPDKTTVKHDLRNMAGLNLARRTQSEAEAKKAGKDRRMLDWSSFEHNGVQMCDLRPLRMLALLLFTRV